MRGVSRIVLETFWKASGICRRLALASTSMDPIPSFFMLLMLRYARVILIIIRYLDFERRKSPVFVEVLRPHVFSLVEVL